jgi:autotransporter-associated beta strand protein
VAPSLAYRVEGHGDPFVIDYVATSNRLAVSPTIYDVFNVDENLATPGFGFPISTIYPGFSRADTLPANSVVSLRFTSPLRYWNPSTGPLDPLPISFGTIGVVNRSAAIATITATGVGGVEPLLLDTFVGAPGEHRHFTAYELANPDAPGLYGFWAEATATGPSYPAGGTAASSPFLIVLNWGIENEQQYQDGVARLSALPEPVITIIVPTGTQTQTQAGYPTLSGSLPVLKTGSGTLVLDQNNTLTGTTTIHEGTLRLTSPTALAASRIVPLAGGTLAISPGLVTTVGGLSPLAGGLTDAGSGMITVASGLSATDLVAAIVAGRGDGSWTGTGGITSSTAAAHVARGTARAVGWLDHGDGSLSCAYAAVGDTNLDWSVDVLDAANVLASGKFNAGDPATWVEGDFNYDGVVDVLDAADFITTGLYNQGGYNQSALPGTTVAAVPEPSAWLLVAAGVGCLALLRHWPRSPDLTIGGFLQTAVVRR